MSKTQNHQSGFGAVLAVIIVAVILALGGSGYVVYRAHHKTTNPPTTSSSVAKTSTPPAKKSSGSTSTSTQPTTAYFTIKEWGVQAPYSGTDLTYSVITGSPNQIALTSSSLPQCTDSTLGNTGLVGRYLPTDNVSTGPIPKTAQQYFSQDFAASGATKPAYTKVGSYYYMYIPPQDECSTTTSTTLINSVRSEIENIVDNLQAVSN